MNEELAYRTIAYLIGHYKTNDETTMNREEIAAINFILSENQQLKEQLKTSEKARNNCYKYLKNPPEDMWSGHSIEKAIELLDIDKGE